MNFGTILGGRVGDDAPTSPFDDATDVYTRARPEYPPALWDGLDAMLPNGASALSCEP